MTTGEHIVLELIGGPQDGRSFPVRRDLPAPPALRLFRSAMAFNPGTVEGGYVWRHGGTRTIWEMYQHDAKRSTDARLLYVWRGLEVDREGAEPVRATRIEGAQG